VLATSLINRNLQNFRAVFALHHHLTEIQMDEKSSQYSSLKAGAAAFFLIPY
jgi:hypothetical protein